MNHAPVKGKVPPRLVTGVAARFSTFDLLAHDVVVFLHTTLGRHLHVNISQCEHNLCDRDCSPSITERSSLT